MTTLWCFSNMGVEKLIILVTILSFLLSLPFQVLTYKGKYSPFISLLAFAVIDNILNDPTFGFPFLSYSYCLPNESIFSELLEIIGSGGLTITIFGINYLFYITLENRTSLNVIVSLLFALALVVLSLIIRKHNHNNNQELETSTISLVNTTLNCHTEKYRLTPKSNRDILLKEIKGLSVNHNNVLIFPENAIFEKNIDRRNAYNKINYALDSLKNPYIIGFIENTVNKQGKLTHNSIYTTDGTKYSVRSKQSLVPFEERKVFDLQLLDKLSLGKFDFHLKVEECLPLRLDNLNIYPFICYESYFDKQYNFDYSMPFLIAVLENDGWIMNDRACFIFNRVLQNKAIEYRKEIVKSVNYGTSGHISPKGEIIKESVESFTTNTKGNSIKTFYSQNRSLIKVFVVTVMLLMVYITSRSQNSY